MKLKDTFRYRNVWMEIAILIVLLFHSGIHSGNAVLSTIQYFGYGGVDIFLFASGIGCYHSFNKNNDAAAFMYRRILRIMPMYLCFLVVWLLYKRLFFEMPVSAMIGNLFCVQNFTVNGYDFNWYISAMWLMYLFAPLMASVVSKLNRWLTGLGILALLLVFTVSYWNSYTFIITITRIPIFFLGMFVSKKAFDGFELKKWHTTMLFAISIAAMVLLLFLKTHLTYDQMWLLGMFWYPFIALVPGLCLGISLLCQLLEKTKFGAFAVKTANYLGSKTFSVYLIHIFILDIFSNLLVGKGICEDTNRNRLLLIIPIALGSILLELANAFLQKLLSYVTAGYRK